MATSGKLTLRGIPVPQWPECVFFIHQCQRNAARDTKGKVE